MKQIWLRLLPTLLVGALLVLAVAGPLRRPAARAEGPATEMYYPKCDNLLQTGGNVAPLQLDMGYGVTQPVSILGNVSACSLYISTASYSGGQVSVLQWDPLTLAPDPTTVALRTRAFQTSELTYNRFRETFDPPIVTRVIPQVAEPPRSTVALDFSNTGWEPMSLHYDPDGASAIPEAMTYPAGGFRLPLAGSHPVLSHAFCGGDAALQGLYVTQSVMTASALLDTASYEFAQLFSVPVLTRVHWVELAFGTSQYRGGLDAGTLAIVDAEGASTPPASFPPSLVEALFYQYVGNTAFWESHYDFDHFVTLMPGHDYWLVARTNHDYHLYARLATGYEGMDFTGNIGGLYSRLAPTSPWGPVTYRALDFRLIGEPLGLLDAPAAPAAAPSTLQLRVAPNPSRGSSFVSWTGGAGALRFDVLDVRGRRVGGGSGSAGRWLWQATAADGRPLDAGVYFLRAVDDAGRAAIERVVLVR